MIKLLTIGVAALLLLTGCATSYDWEGTADNWHNKVESSRQSTESFRTQH